MRLCGSAGNFTLQLSFVIQKSSNRFSTAVPLTLLTRIVTVAGSVAAGIVIARVLGSETVGTYAVLLLIVNTLVQVFGAGLAAANVFFVGRERILLPAIISNSIVFAALAGIAGAALVYLGSLLRPLWFQDVPAELLMISLATLPFQIWTLFGLNLFLTLGDVRRFNLLDWLSQVYIPINAVVVLLVLGRGLDTLVTFNAIATAVIAITIFILVRRLAVAENGTIAFSPDPSLFVRMVKFGLTINVMNSVLALVLRADVFLVNYFRGLGEAGVYAIAAQCSLLLIMFPNVVGTLIFPSVARTKSNSAELTSTVIRHAAALQLVLCMLAIPAAFLIPYIYGPDFAPATFQFLILLPGAFAIGLQMMLSQHLAGIGEIRLMPYFWIFTLLLGLALYVWAIPAYGGIGAAAASTVIYSMIFLLTLFYFGRHTGEPISHLLLLRSADARALLTRFGW